MPVVRASPKNREVVFRAVVVMDSTLEAGRPSGKAPGLSRGLVQECYAQLQAEGYLITRGGSALPSGPPGWSLISGPAFPTLPRCPASNRQGCAGDLPDRGERRTRLR